MISLQRLYLLLPVLIFFSPLAGCGQQGDDNEYLTISPSEGAALIESEPSLVVLDVRTEDEFTSETGHLSGALLIPVNELEGRLDELEQFKTEPILVYCRSGNRSRRASDLLVGKGFDVIMLDGGIIGWNDAGLPVEKGGAK